MSSKRVLFTILSLIFTTSCFSLSDRFEYKENLERIKRPRLNPSPENKYCILSIPRSGCSWLINIIYFLSQKQTAYIYPGKELVIPKEMLLKGKKEDCIIRSHRKKFLYDMFPNLNTGKNNLLVVVRNYKELIAKSNLNKLDSIVNISDALNVLKDTYFSELGFFENWKGKKLLIYYEDLIKDPASVVSKLCQFFNVDQKKGHMFMKNYKRYQEASVKKYNKTVGVKTAVGSVTKGESLLFYSKAMSKKEKVFVDTAFYESEPFLYCKYLERYKE